jgi:hypothetical protein
MGIPPVILRIASSVLVLCGMIKVKNSEVCTFFNDDTMWFVIHYFADNLKILTLCVFRVKELWGCGEIIPL